MRRSRELLFNPATQKLELLHTPLNTLGVTIEGSPLAEAIRLALRDLRRLGVRHLKPYFYLSTGYGTVAGTTSIALGFYDCTPVLSELNREVRGFQYSFADITDVIRHELGHAFAYAYKLYRRPDFRQVFGVKGNYYLTYPDTERYIKRAKPWSRDFVNPGGDHYAQKHPDDDFAETFMLVLRPRYNWRRDYRRYPGALRKLEFVERLIRELRGQQPTINQQPEPWESLNDFKITLARFYKLRSTAAYHHRATGYIDADLRHLFRRPPAARAGRRREMDYVHADSFIRRHKRDLMAEASRWTGVDQAVVGDLLDKASARTRALDCWVKKDERDRKLVELATYVSYRCAVYALNDTYFAR
jgi:hypothetical protein